MHLMRIGTLPLPIFLPKLQKATYKVSLALHWHWSTLRMESPHNCPFSIRFTLKEKKIYIYKKGRICIYHNT